MVALTGCLSVTTPRFMQPAPERHWEPTLGRARALAAAGHFVQADSLLADYARSYPSSPYALESNYWRSLFQLQEPMASKGASNAVSMLQSYLASNPSASHRLEAEALLRAAARVDTLARITAALSNKVEATSDAAANANARAADARSDARAATADTRDLDAEIRKLKAELAQSREELERIKKRLAEPPAKKPPQ